jgi:5-methylcytosine-specific restriction enzyme B
MNTADRSIALLDTALRRRFEFREIMPDVNVIRKIVLDKIGDDGTDYVELVCEVFEALNRRVVMLLDRDHQIGHSYFLNATSIGELHRTLYRQIFPLLQEYFYNDPERMRRLLGTHDPFARKGFFTHMEAYRRAFDEEVLDEELPWDLHVYPVEDLADALRNTFLDE